MLKDVSQPSAVPLLRIAECLSTTGRFLADRSCRGFDLLDAGPDAPNQFNVWLTLAAVEQAHAALATFVAETRSAVTGVFLLLWPLRCCCCCCCRCCCTLRTRRSS